MKSGTSSGNCHYRRLHATAVALAWLAISCGLPACQQKTAQDNPPASAAGTPPVADRDSIKRADENGDVVATDTYGTNQLHRPNDSLPEQDNDADYAGLPVDVLDGVELVSLPEYTRFSLPRTSLHGRYVAETGGATAWIEISVRTDTLNVERSYSEPGTEVHRKTYPGLRPKSDSVYVTGDAALVTLADGAVLFWERTSDLEFVPDSFWIVYRKKQ